MRSVVTLVTTLLVLHAPAIHAPARAQAPQPVAGFAYSSAGSIYVLPEGGKPTMLVPAKPGEYENYHPVWAPDGTRIAFVRLSTKPGALATPNPTALFVVNADGSGLKRVTERRLWFATQQANWATTPRAGRPCWSPDGTMLAYPEIIMDDARHFSYQPIFVINLDGTGKRAVTAPGPEVFDQDPSWSPDGKQLAFTRNTRAPKGGYSIWVANLTGPGARELTGNWHVSAYSGFHLDAAMPRWSPDGSKIAYMSAKGSRGAHDIWIMDADGSNPQRQTYTFAGVQSPMWSPGGKQIAFTPIWGHTRTIGIFRKNVSGPAIARVGGPEVETDDFDWSPIGADSLISFDVPGQRDGIVFSSPGYQKKASPDPLDLDQINFGNLGYDIFVVMGDGSKPVNVTKTQNVYNVQPSWSPDRKKIAFCSNRGNTHEVVPNFSSTSIYVMNADGSDVTRLTGPGSQSDHSPSWSPDGKQISFVRWDVPKGQSYLCVMNADGTGLRSAGANASYTNKISWSPTGERIAYTLRSGGQVVAVEVADPQKWAQLNPAGTSCFDPAWSANPAVLAMIRSDLQSGSNVNLLTLGGGLTPLMKDKDFHWPTWSPDGCKLAFHQHPLGLWTVNTDATGLAPLSDVDPVARGKEPDWGRGWPMMDRPQAVGPGLLAFYRPGESKEGGKTYITGEISIVKQDGMGMQTLPLEKKQLDDSFEWSIDGTRMFYTLRLKDGKVALFSCKLDGSDNRQLVVEDRVHVPTLSTDGKRLAVLLIRGKNLVTLVMDHDGANQREIPGAVGPYEWSLDSKRILASTTPDRGKTELQEVEVDTGRVRWKTALGGQAVFARYSPDGKMIAFTCKTAGKEQVYLMTSDGTNVRQLTNLDVNAGLTYWSADGKKIHYVTNPFRLGGQAALFVMNSDGSGVKTVWEPKAFFLTYALSPRRGKLALAAGYEDGTSKLFIGNADGSDLKAVADRVDPLKLPKWTPEGPSTAVSQPAMVAKLSAQELAKAEGDKLALGAKSNLEAWNKQAAHFQDQLQKDPNNAGLQQQLGATLLQLGKPAEAAQALQKAVQGEPNKAEHHNALAQALAAQDKWDQALAAAQNAIRLDKDNKQFEGTLGHIAGKLAQQHAATAQKHAANLDWAKAVQALKDAALLQPKNPQHHADLGAVLLKANQAQEAAAALQQAVKLQPGHADWHANLGLAYKQMNDWKGAAKAYAEALHLKPGHAPYQQEYIEAAKKHGDWAQLESVYRGLLFANPTNAATLAALAEAVLRQGRVDEAKALIQQALKNNLAKSDMPELVQNFLTATEGGQPFQLPGLPSVLGLTQDSARTKLEAAGYKANVKVGESAKLDDLVDRVYAMDPGPGTLLAKGSEVQVVAYARPSALAAGMVKVPDLLQLSAAKAKEMLEKDGLKATFKLGRAAPVKEQALLVYDVAPASGSVIAKASEVTVYLYSQPDETPNGAGGVPAVIGLDAKKARALLEEAGYKARFVLGRKAPAKAQSLLAYETEPPAGAKDAMGSEVTVTLYGPNADASTDPAEAKENTVVPDCLTLPLEEASAKLKAAGLLVKSKVGRPATFKDQVERVYQMNPAPGARLQRGDTVELLIFGSRKD